MSAVLHALADLTPKRAIQLEYPEDGEEALPVTSRLCQWNVPRKRKESSIAMSEAVFQKHDYSRPNKKKIKPIEDFDPRPEQYKGTATSRLPALLDSVRGQELCVSFLFNEKCQHWGNNQHVAVAASSVHIPNISELRDTITEFKRTLCISDDKAREIERDTREQRHSSLWHSVRRYRITSSLFGIVLAHRDTTIPDNLVLRILQPKNFSSQATQHGIEVEPLAISKYRQYQQSNGHPDYTVCASGFIVNTTHPFLGASPDGAVYDPSSTLLPYGFLEIKCPYTQLVIFHLLKHAGFCCRVDSTTGHVVLKENHAYFFSSPRANGNRLLTLVRFCCVYKQGY